MMDCVALLWKFVQKCRALNRTTKCTNAPLPLFERKRTYTKTSSVNGQSHNCVCTNATMDSETESRKVFERIQTLLQILYVYMDGCMDQRAWAVSQVTKQPLVVVYNTNIDPRAMVVHLHHTPVQGCPALQTTVH